MGKTSHLMSAHSPCQLTFGQLHTLQTALYSPSTPDRSHFHSTDYSHNLCLLSMVLVWEDKPRRTRRVPESGSNRPSHRYMFRLHHNDIAEGCLFLDIWVWGRQRHCSKRRRKLRWGRKKRIPRVEGHRRVLEQRKGAGMNACW